ncbi:MAG: zinc-dependent peptidase [Burkholderiaceae bacterium]|nr:zinc-dependent peptidase [Burkholderiaceae bacterium]
MPFLIISIATLLLLTWLLREPLFTEWRRRKVRRQPFPAEWRQIVRRRVPYFRSMPTDLQLQLKKHIQVFLAEKPFIGCRGLVVTDEMRVTIAAQACLLLLNRRTDYFAQLRQILVYPDAFVVDRVQADGSGVVQDRRLALSGESWSLGQVILSWQDTVEGAEVADDGRNVVIHEFAHQLDQENGAANGAPRMTGRVRRERWARVLNEEFEVLQRRERVGQRQPSLLSDYGATDPAEFFAVASEVFFEQPQRLATEHAALYRELSNYYRVNPLSW